MIRAGQSNEPPGDNDPRRRSKRTGRSRHGCRPRR
jgi:hypothetical protein